MKALKPLGAETDDDSDVKQVVFLFEQFTSSRASLKGNRIWNLWRQEAHIIDQSALIQTDERVKDLLGPSLVDVITQKHQKLPV